MSTMNLWALGAALLLGCATPYEYSFRPASPAAAAGFRPGERAVIEDADLRAEILLDPTTQAILLELTNKTDQVLQVGWTRITMTCSDGSTTTPRPEVDLGWIPPGATQPARLVSFVLPRAGDRAAAYQGKRFELAVPVVVRRETRTYRYSFTADARPRRASR
jgi:hypothetical protein